MNLSRLREARGILKSRIRGRRCVIIWGKRAPREELRLCALSGLSVELAALRAFRALDFVVLAD